MKIELSKFFTRSKIFPDGEMRYIFYDLEKSGDLEVISKILKEKFEVQSGKDIKGVWFIRRELEKDGHKILLFWDEDIGTFFVSGDKPEDKWLENLIIEAVPFIEDYYDNMKPVK
jgi:hypothetical protein